MLRRLDINTSNRVEFQDITRIVRDAVADSGVKSGVCHVSVPHTTAALTVNECADPDVVADIIAELDRLVPRQGDYRHAEGNSPAHIKAMLVGSSETLFIGHGELILGTWQGIFFCEFDGPRNRKLLVKIVPDVSV
ncbi:MAG: secondary thiamine-phosphate synthase enzyme YjbQ [Dehalococcoidales bacterium]|nr:secondary thiamine-phosphate synthase enzyme YjbQ [Dehalococcoidales bacterium]